MIKIINFEDTETDILHDIYKIAINNIKRQLISCEHLNFNELINDIILPTLTDAVRVVTDAETLKNQDCILYADPEIFANEMLYDKSILGFGEMIISESFNYYCTLKCKNYELRCNS